MMSADSKSFIVSEMVPVLVAGFDVLVSGVLFADGDTAPYACRPETLAWKAPILDASPKLGVKGDPQRAPNAVLLVGAQRLITEGEMMLSDSEAVPRNKRSELGLSKKYFFGA
mmetsp:Transcript_5449/g.10682  ORF Transcript_5449/g.10682 Transcript_5449/m.10682 type:complete len:113 (-) Transcript_5449:611-949(-)